MNEHRRTTVAGWLRTRMGLVLATFLLIAAFFLLTEHTAHMWGVLPFLLLALCPLLHLFMHGGHGGGHGDSGNGTNHDMHGSRQ